MSPNYYTVIVRLQSITKGVWWWWWWCRHCHNNDNLPKLTMIMLKLEEGAGCMPWTLWWRTKFK